MAPHAEDAPHCSRSCMVIANESAHCKVNGWQKVGHGLASLFANFSSEDSEDDFQPAVTTLSFGDKRRLKKQISTEAPACDSSTSAGTSSIGELTDCDLNCELSTGEFGDDESLLNPIKNRTHRRTQRRKVNRTINLRQKTHSLVKSHSNWWRVGQRLGHALRELDCSDDEEFPRSMG